MNNKLKIWGFALLYPSYKWKYNRLKNNFPKVINSIETLNVIIKSKKSLSRFGDGEFNLIIGNKIGFQENNKQLANRLKQVLESDSDSCFIAIPDVFQGLSRFRLFARYFWLHKVIENWNSWKEFLPNKKYLDSLCSRFYMDYQDKTNSYEMIRLWKKLWDRRDIVIIEGESSKMGIGNKLFDNCKSINRIICPSKNAYNIYDKIYNECMKMSKDKLMIIALGPTASILAYDLSLIGYQAIDSGHLDIEYNWMINKSKEKIGIAGRKINEISKQSIDNIFDEDYQKQIIVNLTH